MLWVDQNAPVEVAHLGRGVSAARTNVLLLVQRPGVASSAQGVRLAVSLTEGAGTLGHLMRGG